MNNQPSICSSTKKVYRYSSNIPLRDLWAFNIVLACLKCLWSRSALQCCSTLSKPMDWGYCPARQVSLKFLLNCCRMSRQMNKMHCYQLFWFQHAHNVSQCFVCSSPSLIVPTISFFFLSNAVKALTAEWKPKCDKGFYKSLSWSDLLSDYHMISYLC